MVGIMMNMSLLDDGGATRGDDRKGIEKVIDLSSSSPNVGNYFTWGTADESLGSAIPFQPYLHQNQISRKHTPALKSPV